ncbi:hypothetical protein SSBR45G_55710 [Bradyrhizobium sp. SSBR45G]|uniref:hypothetical protein n=1 Tax=unclassified Bradyrhizobium TaxID=2631580 RepID=UPI0023428D47|nr:MULTISPECIES: hypothetical protein [unclassified Bradyrhizobium]GLH80662.1 hypothetical protein SSBR45G_55710 [Bradyrhizobium sp. SSBR45G]GLH88051.1 hypothetical protein SSBR45R_55120 [Bradyrhizobium sp. SSBR45R]
MKFIPKVLDRAAFWPWAVLLVLAHMLLTFATMSGAKLGGLDLLVVIALALVVGARFRDIGWPAWMGISFMLLTMGLGPLGVAAYAIANNLPMDGFMAAMNVYGWVSGIVNFALLIVAASVPGRQPRQAASEAIAQVFGLEGQSASSGASYAAAASAGASADEAWAFGQMGTTLVVAAGGILVLVVSGVLWIYARESVPSRSYSPPVQSSQQAAPAQTVPPPPQPAPAYAATATPAGGSGVVLDKATSDFLRQLQSVPSSQSRPR